MSNDTPSCIFECADVALVGERAVFGIIAVLNRLHEEHDQLTVLDRGRIPIRVVAALCDPAQYSPRTVARLTGCTDVSANEFCKMLAGAGDWAGEPSYETLRSFLVAAMVAGEHPREAAPRFGIDVFDYNSLDHLLDLEDYWNTTKVGRVAVAALGGASVAHLCKVGNISRRTARRWRRWAAAMRSAQQ
jgi:hypothetical protein